MASVKRAGFGNVSAPFENKYWSREEDRRRWGAVWIKTETARGYEEGRRENNKLGKSEKHSRVGSISDVAPQIIPTEEEA